SFSEHVLFDLIELMDAADASCIFAIGASLFAEAGTEADKGLGQVLVTENLVLVHAGDRDLRGAYQECIFALDSINLVAQFGELPAANEAEISRHCRDYQWCE